MNWQELSDQKLVELCLEGNEDAWVELLRRYTRLIQTVAAKTLRARGIRVPDGLLEEMLSDSLERILQNDRRAFRELKWMHEGSLRGLLGITAETTTKDWIRRVSSGKRDHRKEESLTYLVNIPPNPVNEEARNQRKILLEQLANCLKKVIHDEADRDRDVAIFQLSFSQRITASDLARVYQMDIRKVENTLARMARLAKAHCL
jgi:hypothetical protein